MRRSVVAILSTIGLLMICAMLVSGMSAIRGWRVTFDWQRLFSAAGIMGCLGLFFIMIANVIATFMLRDEDQPKGWGIIRELFKPIELFFRWFLHNCHIVGAGIIVLYAVAAIGVGTWNQITWYTRATDVVTNFETRVVTEVGQIRYENSTLKDELTQAEITIRDMQAVQDGLKQQIAELTRDNAAMKETIRLAASAGIKIPASNPQKPGQK